MIGSNDSSYSIEIESLYMAGALEVLMSVTGSDGIMTLEVITLGNEQLDYIGRWKFYGAQANPLVTI